MEGIDWVRDFQGAVTVCDLSGIVLYMNARSKESFRKSGGEELIGRSLLDCHPEPARSKLVQLLETGESNVYTTEKNGIKKIIYQAPWHLDGRRRGMVELSFEVPFNPPHFIR
jgi:transcriptional regulator with PAS, ATPase and Fis domain